MVIAKKINCQCFIGLNLTFSFKYLTGFGSGSQILSNFGGGPDHPVAMPPEETHIIMRMAVLHGHDDALQAGCWDVSQNPFCTLDRRP